MNRNRQPGESIRGALAPTEQQRVSPLAGALARGREEGYRLGTDRDDPDRVVTLIWEVARPNSAE